MGPGYVPPWQTSNNLNLWQKKTPPSTIPPRTPRPIPLPQHTPPCPPPQNAPPCPPPQNAPPSPPPIQPNFLFNTPMPPPHKATLTPKTDTLQYPVTHNDALNSTNILSNLDLFNAHITVIDQELNTPPTRNSSNTYVTQGDNVIYPSITPNKAKPEHMHNSQNHSFNHSNMSDPMITTENLLSSTSAPINEPTLTFFFFFLIENLKTFIKQKKTLHPLHIPLIF